eukprot:TRINITY_DN3580_c0_g2_i4.p1 TRINITY_DN3580_c0_g2~~TRINITY_DN3580_c0_g2_i4.p1  ORF type:complete len:274 (+),score=-21.68 TRINITY_DN3580_c0_g2_i4:628-1449(+)
MIFFQTMINGTESDIHHFLNYKVFGLLDSYLFLITISFLQQQTLHTQVPVSDETMILQKQKFSNKSHRWEGRFIQPFKKCQLAPFRSPSRQGQAPIRGLRCSLKRTKYSFSQKRYVTLSDKTYLHLAKSNCYKINQTNIKQVQRIAKANRSPAKYERKCCFTDVFRNRKICVRTLVQQIQENIKVKMLIPTLLFSIEIIFACLIIFTLVKIIKNASHCKIINSKRIEIALLLLIFFLVISQQFLIQQQQSYLIVNKVQSTLGGCLNFKQLCLI